MNDKMKIYLKRILSGLPGLWLCSFVSAVVLLLFLSPDSYLYDIYGYHADSSWFFTCGKAWMHGMVPYVDFSDSKGPLLWLIYGAGYLLNGHSYVGVYWVACVFYAFTFFYAYRTARLFVPRRQALYVQMLMPCCLFFIFFHNETHAEDFCYTFISAALFHLCAALRDDRPTSRRTARHAFAVGVSVACCLLMKWSVALMVGTIALVLLYCAYKRRLALSCLGGGLLGIAVPLTPFLIYFLVWADLGALVHEYFLNTAATIDSSLLGGLKTYARELNSVPLFTIPLFAGVAAFCRRFSCSYGLLFCLFCFFAGATHHNIYHYYTVMLPFSVFALMWLFDALGRRYRLRMRHVVLASVLLTAADLPWVRTPLVFVPNADRQACYDVAYVMSSVRQPKVMYMPIDVSAGTASGALPACKYWAQQTGFVPEMKAERDRALENRRADFVIVLNEWTPKEQVTRLQELGYVRYGEARLFSTYMCQVYYRKGLRLKTGHAQFTAWDLLLKRNLFGV